MQQPQKTPTAVSSHPEASPAHGGGGASGLFSSTIQVEGGVSGLLATPTHSRVYMGTDHGVEPEGTGR